MNITNAEHLINRNDIQESSNIINGKGYLTVHNMNYTPGYDHKDTLLVEWKDGKTTPQLRKWCKDNKKGLEDPHWLEDVNGYDYMGCEAKPYDANGKNIDQTDIDIFKCITGTNDWKYILSIKPTNNYFDNWSCSSIVLFMADGDLFFLYEGRHSKATWDDFKTGFGSIDLATEKVDMRWDEPISKDRLVPDCIEYKNGLWKYSFHTYDGENWISQIYKSNTLAQVLIYVEDVKYNGKDIGAYHFNGYFYVKGKGLFKVSNQTHPPVNNGGNMIPTASFDGDKLVSTPIEGADKIAWQCNLVAGNFIGFGNPFDISGKNYKQDGARFWCYGMLGNTRISDDSVKIVYKSGVITPEPDIPSTGDFDKVKALDLVEQLRIEIEKA